MADCYIYKLPNELLLQVFATFPTPQLLSLTLVSHRIFTIILRILHNRIRAASALESHMVLLECYHPSARLTEPSYFCTHIGTDGLETYENTGDTENRSAAEHLGRLLNMYSRYRPYRSQTSAGASSESFPRSAVIQTLSLDGPELFTQLCAVTNIVKLGPRDGLIACQEVEEGVVRVFRVWLKDMAQRTHEETAGTAKVLEEIGVNVTDTAMTAAPQNSTRKNGLDDDRILWVDSSRNTGLRLNVRERKLRRDTPILVEINEDMPVSYEIAYDELLIRTSHLLLCLEKALVQDDNSTRKAVVFGSFG